MKTLKYKLILNLLSFVLIITPRFIYSQYQPHELVFTNLDCDNLILNLNQELKNINNNSDLTQQLQTILLNAIQQSMLSYHQKKNLSALNDEEGVYLSSQVIDCIKQRLVNLEKDKNESTLNSEKEDNINLVIGLLLLFGSSDSSQKKCGWCSSDFKHGDGFITTPSLNCKTPTLSSFHGKYCTPACAVKACWNSK